MKHKKPNSLASNLANNISKSHNRLLSSGAEIFKSSVLAQVDLLTKSELLNLIQIGHVTVDRQSILDGTFTECNVQIIFAEFGPTLDHMINEWDLAWIIGFNYFHCDVFPTNDEENPTNNPQWPDIVSMDRSDLISKLKEFMFPYFSNIFEICLVELFQDVKSCFY